MRLEEGHRRQRAGPRVCQEARKAVLDAGAQRGVRHDRRRVLHRVAEPAVEAGGGAVSETFAVPRPADVAG